MKMIVRSQRAHQENNKLRVCFQVVTKFDLNYVDKIIKRALLKHVFQVVLISGKDDEHNTCLYFYEKSYDAIF